MTPYPLLLQASGLSMREAAELHGVRLSSVQNWATGRRGAPEGVVGQMRELVAIQDIASDEALQVIRNSPPGAEAIEIGYPCDDAEAHQLGWPCVSAWRTMCGLLISKLSEEEFERVVLVPRGTTLATALAVDAH